MLFRSVAEAPEGVLAGDESQSLTGMPRFLTVFFILIITAVVSAAQNAVTYIADPEHPGEKMLLGAATKQAIINDSSFSWYVRNQKGYEPSTSITNVVSRAKDSLSFIVFAGTWCDDSQFILPRFFRLLELAGVDDSRVHFYAVDRDKKTPDGSADTFHIERVPTMIVMASGKEIGRVVEYGKTGHWDEELAALVK